MAEVKKILFVEDQEDIQAVTTIALESVGGFELEVCSSGQEALDKASGFGPELLLLDVMMPGMDGPSTLNALQQIPGLENVPAIFMTAKVQPDEVSALKELGAIGVISKPFNPMELANQIREILQENL